MPSDNRRCLVCNCEKTMPLDAGKLARALKINDLPIHTQLCRGELDRFETSLADDTDVLVACVQEAPLFHEVAEEMGKASAVSFVNIRETAGWSDEADSASPKIAALLASADYRPKPARLKSIRSNGMCLVYGAGQAAFETARILSTKLSVTLLLSSDEEFVLPTQSDVPIFRGDITQASGSFGAFSITVDNYASLMPSARGALSFVMARNGARSDCSLILDLSGKAPLVTGHGKRDGYRRVDAGNPAEVLRAVMDLSDMVGEFEKPIYVDYTAETCAHARSRKTGCSKCLDVCPAGAIADNGDHIQIDVGICGGCGSCFAVCPTGSIAYRYPDREDLIGRAQALLSAYKEAGGEQPVILVHDENFGVGLISAMARYGKGLPANMLPIAMHAVTTVGHVELAAMLASGAEAVLVLMNPALTDEASGLETEIALVNHITAAMGFGDAPRARLILERDPDVVEAGIRDQTWDACLAGASFTARGTKRDIARLSLKALAQSASAEIDVIPLPAKAPYGSIDIDQEACTLCMSCVSACPANAMMDTPGEPCLRFVESACVQCGLCVATCPESALTLKPQLDLTPGAMQPMTLYEEEPFNCVSCGKPFATQSTIKRISEQLAGKHSMYASADMSKLIEMCDDCRVSAQANSANDPFRMGSRPRVRTTEDYVKAEKGLTVDDFLTDD